VPFWPTRFCCVCHLKFVCLPTKTSLLLLPLEIQNIILFVSGAIHYPVLDLGFFLGLWWNLIIHWSDLLFYFMVFVWSYFAYFYDYFSTTNHNLKYTTSQYSWKTTWCLYREIQVIIQSSIVLLFGYRNIRNTIKWSAQLLNHFKQLAMSIIEPGNPFWKEIQILLTC
jgi:hypothetical protein